MIHRDDIIDAVATDGPGYREIVDVNTGQFTYHPNLVHGLYADASPTDARIVFTFCESIPGDPDNARQDAADDGFAQRPANRLGYELATMSIDPGVLEWNRLTEYRGLKHFPVWSPDGTKIAYLRSPAEYLERGPGYLALYVTGANGSEQRLVPRIEPGSVGLFPTLWSPDGQRLAYIRPGDNPDEGLGTAYTAHVEIGSRERTTVGYTTALPAWSPDGTEVAIATYADGVGGGPRRQIDGTAVNGGGILGYWDGLKLYHLVCSCPPKKSELTG